MILRQRVLRVTLALALSGLAGSAGAKDLTPLKDPVLFRGHTNTVYGVAFSADGKTMATAGADKTIRLWDVDTRQRLALIRYTDRVTCLAFSADGKMLASGSSDMTITLWDVARDAQGQIRGRKIATFAKDHKSPIGNIAFAPDGKTVATVASRDEVIRLWDVASGKVRTLCKGHQAAPSTVVFSADNKRLISAAGDSTIRVWDTATGEEKDTFKGHDGEVWSVAMSADGKRLVSGGERDKTVTVWDAATANVTNTLEGHTQQVWFVAFNRAGKTIVSVGRDGTVRVWDTAGKKERAVFNWVGSGFYQFPGFPAFMAFAPNSALLAIGIRDDVKVWDLSHLMD
jgi:WD40 repeat protein